MNEENDSPAGSANGATSPSESTATPPPSLDAARNAARAAGRAAFLERSKNGETTTEEKPPTPAASESPEPAEEDAGTDPGDSDDADVDTETEETEQTPDEGEPEPAAAKDAEEPDSDLSKRLAEVQKTKKRALDEVNAAKAELKAEVERQRQALDKEYGSAIAEAKAFAKLKARAKVDVVSVVRSLGIDGDDLDFAARQIHTEWKAWKGDPSAKDQSAAVIRRREHETALEETRRELQELKDSIAKREEAQQANQYAQQYLAKVEKSVDDKSPIVRSMMAKNSEKTLKRLGQVAYDLAAETGEEPSPADVVKALEKIRREELEELGLDPAAVGKTANGQKAVPKTKPVTAGETKTAPKKPVATTANNEQPRPKRLTRDEVRAAFIKGQLG